MSSIESRETPPLPAPRYTRPISFTDIFHHRPAGSKLCRHVLNIPRSRNDYGKPRESFAFAATCRLIHRHMSRLNFQRVDVFQTRPEKMLDWHPDSLHSIRYVMCIHILA